jgi:hypothetical protein
VLDLQIVKLSNFVVKGLLKIVHRFNERRNSRENNSRTTNKTATTLKSGEKPNESQNTSRRTNPKKNVVQSGRVVKRQKVSDVSKNIQMILMMNFY